MQSAFILMACASLMAVSRSQGLSGKSIIFPQSSAVDHVKLLPATSPSLTAFTLCLRASVEVSRDISLFSYAVTGSYNELLIFLHPKGIIQLEVAGQAIKFQIAELTEVLTPMCVTWESSSGLARFWVNGQRSLAKVVKQGYTIKPGGVYILGQEQDSLGGGFQSIQSLQGEETQVNLWDWVLPHTEIQDLSWACYSIGGNVINWATVGYEKVGDAIIQANHDCRVTK